MGMFGDGAALRKSNLPAQCRSRHLPPPQKCNCPDHTARHPLIQIVQSPRTRYPVPMRIISGHLRGRPLLGPPSDTTRPITDRAKQSLFDYLSSCYEGGTVLDCFAGTGSMGLECLSRGAARAIFIERDRGALDHLRKNIDALQLADKSFILPIDAYKAGDHPDLRNLVVAFVDPPYSHMATGHLRHKIDRLVQSLAHHAMVDGGIISLRHPANVSVDAPAMGVKVIREMEYGDMAITWLTRSP